MIHKNTIAKYVISSIGLATLLVGFACTASADTTVGVSASINTVESSRLQTIISRSNGEIAERITSLNNLATRIANMKNVPASEVSNIAAEVQTTIGTLNTIQSKIDTDTNVAVALKDEKTIFDTVRVYALVIPQGYDIASSDRVATIVSLMNAIQVKLQTRITAAQTAGKNVNEMQVALSDMNAKISDASFQAQSAQNGVALLVPDQGNTTVLASNHAALLSARNEIKVSSSDLKIAREDIQTVINQLQGMPVSASVNATVTQ